MTWYKLRPYWGYQTIRCCLKLLSLILQSYQVPTVSFFLLFPLLWIMIVGFEDDQRRPNLAHSMETKDSFFDSVHVSGNRETKLASPGKSTPLSLLKSIFTFYQTNLIATAIYFGLRKKLSLKIRHHPMHLVLSLKFW